MTADNGLINVESPHDVETSTKNLETSLKNKGMKLIERVNHVDNGKLVGKTLHLTELLFFGNPKAGTPFIQAAQSAALDLPQAFLTCEADDGQV